MRKAIVPMVGLLCGTMLSVHAATSQTPPTVPPTPMLDTGLPNLFPTPPPLIFGASTDPPPAGPLLPSSLCSSPCIVTGQYNKYRTDANTSEPGFTTTNVSSMSQTSKARFQVDTSGVPAGTVNPIYAQPLYVSNLTIGGSAHNVLFVATLNGDVYAFDADSTGTVPSTAALWYRDENQTGTIGKGLKHNCAFGNGAGISVQNPIGYLDFAGVVSTPVIDLDPISPFNKYVMYVVNLCTSGSTNPLDTTRRWWLNALDIQTGATITKVEISYNPVAGGPQHAFDARRQIQRPNLLLVGDDVSHKSLIVGFGTGTDETGGQNQQLQYQGWLFPYDVTNPSNPLALQNFSNPYSTQCDYPPESGGSFFCTPLVPGTFVSNGCGQGGGVWQGGKGPAANGLNLVFFAAGNGGFQYCANCQTYCAGTPPSGGSMQKFTGFGEAVMKINLTDVWNTTTGTAPFWPIDYFVPAGNPPDVTPLNNCGSSGTAPCSFFQWLNENDADMGVSGPLLFDDYYIDPPGTTQANTSMVVTATKSGYGYVSLQSYLGQYAVPDSEVARFNINNAPSPPPNNQPPPNPNCLLSGQCDETRTLAWWKPAGSTAGGFLVAWPWFEMLTSYQWQKNASGTQYNFQYVNETATPFPSPPFPQGRGAGFPGGTL